MVHYLVPPGSLGGGRGLVLTSKEQFLQERVDEVAEVAVGARAALSEEAPHSVEGSGHLYVVNFIYM